MVSLERRLELLEDQARDQRNRQRAERLARRHGLDAAELHREFTIIEAEVARLKAQGAGERQILEHLAARAGITVERLEAESEQFVNDTGGDDEW